MPTSLLVWSIILLLLSALAVGLAGLLFLCCRKRRAAVVAGKKNGEPSDRFTPLYDLSCEADNYRAGCIVVLVVAFVALVACVITLFLSVDHIKTESVSQQTALNAQYVQNQNVLSTYVTSYEEQLGIANLQSDKIKGIITSAVAGRGNISDFVDPSKSPLYAALAEAYPKVTLTQYQQLISYIQQGRGAFQKSQNKLLDMLSKFDSWQKQGFILHPWLVSLTGAPSDVLHITNGNQVLTAEAAEAQMWQIVRNPTAVASIETGVDTGLSSK